MVRVTPKPVPLEVTLSVRPVVAVITAAVAASLALSGCSSGKTANDKPKQASVTVKKQVSLHDLLPAAVKSKGQLVMATDPSYAPIEFTKANGFQGFDVDLANALGSSLGLKIVIRKATFDGILAGINAKRFDFAMSAFTDNAEREKANDFVTYFSAGTSIGVKKGNPKKVATQNDLCGLKVAAEKGTIQATALTKKTAGGAITLLGTCLKNGKKAPSPVLLPNQGQVNAAVVSGRADAFTGDSPIVAYQSKLVGGQIQLAGKTTDVAPYGIAFPKNSPLAPIFQKALTKLIADGTYKKIVDTWGLQSGAITAAKINGAG